MSAVPEAAHTRKVLPMEGDAQAHRQPSEGEMIPEDVDITGSSGDNVESVYGMGENLGKGSFAVVKIGRRRSDGLLFAVKIIDKTNPAFDPGAMKKEISIMRCINHSNCIHLHEVYQGPTHICLVLDLVTGGELFDRIISKGHYSEKNAAEVTQEVLNAIAYLHKVGIVHRDLKPENLLYMSNDESVPEYNQIKVADFGLARSNGQSDAPMRTMCGTPGYVAPEILDPRITEPDGYGPEVDVWSIGVILYIMLCGFPPFYSENTVTLFRQIRRADYTFPSPFWDNISASAKDLLCRMLIVDPRKRLTAAQCLNHHWVVNASHQEDKALGSQHKAFLLIRRLPLFEQVDPVCLSEVTARLKRVTAEVGQYVVRAGDEGTCMYFVGSCPGLTIGSGIMLGEELARGIIRSYCLNVYIDGVMVTQLGTGDYFGEIGLMFTADNRRTADVVATTTLELFELSREDVFTVCKMFPILEARLHMMAQVRLRRSNSRCADDGRSFSPGSSGEFCRSTSTEREVGQRALQEPEHEVGQRALQEPEREVGQRALQEPDRVVCAHNHKRVRRVEEMRIGSRMGMMDNFETQLVHSTAEAIDWGSDHPVALTRMAEEVAAHLPSDVSLHSGGGERYSSWDAYIGNGPQSSRVGLIQAGSHEARVDPWWSRVHASGQISRPYRSFELQMGSAVEGHDLRSRQMGTRGGVGGPPNASWDASSAPWDAANASTGRRGMPPPPLNSVVDHDKSGVAFGNGGGMFGGSPAAVGGSVPFQGLRQVSAAGANTMGYWPTATHTQCRSPKTIPQSETSSYESSGSPTNADHADSLVAAGANDNSPHAELHTSFGVASTNMPNRGSPCKTPLQDKMAFVGLGIPAFPQQAHAQGFGAQGFVGGSQMSPSSASGPNQPSSSMGMSGAPMMPFPTLNMGALGSPPMSFSPSNVAAGQSYFSQQTLQHQQQQQQHHQTKPSRRRKGIPHKSSQANSNIMEAKSGLSPLLAVRTAASGASNSLPHSGPITGPITGGGDGDVLQLRPPAQPLSGRCSENGSVDVDK